MLATTQSYQIVARDLPRSLDRIAKAPGTAREVAYYKAAIGSIKSVDDFLANDRVYRFAMTAFGLEDMAYAKAFMRKVLTEGIDTRDAFANQLSDRRYRAFAETFNFKRHGPATTAFARAQAGTVDRFVRQTLETQAGQDNEGVRLALYFQRMGANLRSPFEILADPALLKVAQVALQLPASLSNADIDKQAALIAGKLDLASLKDPKAMDAFLTRFTSLYELEAGRAASAPILQLIAPSGSAGIRPDLLTTLQTLRLGR